MPIDENTFSDYSDTENPYYERVRGAALSAVMSDLSLTQGTALYGLNCAVPGLMRYAKALNNPEFDKRSNQLISALAEVVTICESCLDDLRLMPDIATNEGAVSHGE